MKKLPIILDSFPFCQSCLDCTPNVNFSNFAMKFLFILAPPSTSNVARASENALAAFIATAWAAVVTRKKAHYCLVRPFCPYFVLLIASAKVKVDFAARTLAIAVIGRQVQHLLNLPGPPAVDNWAKCWMLRINSEHSSQASKNYQVIIVPQELLYFFWQPLALNYWPIVMNWSHCLRLPPAFFITKFAKIRSSCSKDQHLEEASPVCTTT